MESTNTLRRIFAPTSRANCQCNAINEPHLESGRCTPIETNIYFVASHSNAAASRSFIQSIDYLANPESSLIGCSAKPADRIGTRFLDSYATMANTPQRWSGSRFPMRCLEMLKSSAQREGVNVALHPSIATS